MTEAQQQTTSTKNQYITPHGCFVVPDTYVVNGELGYGAYGVVCAAEYTPEKLPRAIKQVNFAADPFKVLTARRVLREIKLGKFFDHENVIKVYDILPLAKEESDKVDELYFAMDRMQADLSWVIQNSPLETGHVKYLAYQMFKGMKYIHSAGVVHRDLKPQNILMDGSCQVKIADFGLAREMDEHMTVYVSTRYYRAPELIMMSGASASSQRVMYTNKVDIWSCGCILAELLQKQPLWPGTNPVHQMNLILSTLGTPSNEDLDAMGCGEDLRDLITKQQQDGDWDQQFKDVDPDAVDLLKHLLAFNPAKRMSAEEALDHPFFADYKSEDDEPLCKTPFAVDWDADLDNMEFPEVCKLIYQEMLSFHPEGESAPKDTEKEKDAEKDGAPKNTEKD